MIQKILLAEDEFMIGIALAERLRALGYSVIYPVIRAETMIEKAGDESIDLFIVDVNLKGDIDGITAVGEIVSRNHVPIIFLSGMTDESTRRRAEQLNPLGFLTKPVDAEQIQELIAGL